jgi:hypothetical protein
LSAEQNADPSLKEALSLAARGKGGYSLINNVLFHTSMYCGQSLRQLVVPAVRRLGVLRLAHNSIHWASQKTCQRIVLSGMTWPNVTKDVARYCASCEICQLRARERRTDKIPISVVEKAGQGQAFSHMHADVFGPLLPGQNVQFNHAIIIIDSMSRYPFCLPLRSLHARNICDALMSVFEFTGICNSMVLTIDNASYFRAA